jgi:hypothetical protein
VDDGARQVNAPVVDERQDGGHPRGHPAHLFGLLGWHLSEKGRNGSPYSRYAPLPGVEVCAEGMVQTHSDSAQWFGAAVPIPGPHLEKPSGRTHVEA